MSVSLEETIAKLDEAHKRGLLGIYGVKISRILKLLRELQERRKSDNEIPFGNASFSELDSIINAYEIHGNHKKVVELLKELVERRKLPEIIFCKDCKHKGTKNCVANAWTTIFGFGVKDDFYCGLAERVFNE